ncbi:MAG: hypothetical protein BGN85_12360 [Alphaproteobacteria bacterium 64-11]|nr:hypothetical protein [Alphaproteobacteria bacterium]OJU12316.1 MAG: hypothetical protein BGN85_12360 [Alphaproteobacteria bacterium 64-11]
MSEWLAPGRNIMAASNVVRFAPKAAFQGGNRATATAWWRFPALPISRNSPFHSRRFGLGDAILFGRLLSAADATAIERRMMAA